MGPRYFNRIFVHNLKYEKKYSESEFFSPVSTCWYNKETETYFSIVKGIRMIGKLIIYFEFNRFHIYMINIRATVLYLGFY